jgi:hypothetical protein
MAESNSRERISAARSFQAIANTALVKLEERRVAGDE